MGMITIDIRGSFPQRGVHRETAMKGGHAAAIGRAIAHLTAMLPEAIALDHQLHADGEHPPHAPFGHEKPSPDPERDAGDHPDRGDCKSAIRPGSEWRELNGYVFSGIRSES